MYRKRVGGQVSTVWGVWRGGRVFSVYALGVGGQWFIVQVGLGGGPTEPPSPSTVWRVESVS